jgi:hypothetical protein
MKELLEWIDRIKTLRTAPGVSRASLFLAEELLADEAEAFRVRVLLKATNNLIDEGFLPREEGSVNFTR